MRSLLIDKINHTNPKSSYPAQGSCSHQQDRRGVCLLEVMQSPGGSALAELLGGVCSVGTRLGNDLECVPLGRVGGGHCCPSQPAWAAGEGQGRTSTPVCEPQGTSPEPLHPPLGLAELLCLSLLLLGCHLLLSVPFCLPLHGVWLLGSTELCLIGDRGMKSCSAASSRPWQGPGQQQEQPCRAHIFGCSVSLSRDSAEGDAL